MALPLPQEEIAPLMRFIAEKVKNVKSPISVRGLAVQFKEETGAWMSINGLKDRALRHRHKIHEMNEFDMETKVKMIFALSAPIDAGFLIEMKKVAEVEVDNQRRIIRYKKKDGGLELGAKHKKLSIDQGEQRDREIIQLLAEKSKTTEKPIVVKSLLREFKVNTGCTDSISALDSRYRRVRNAIYHSPDIDKNTKIKMMFISNVELSENILKELRKDADVEVDDKRRITRYKSLDGRLDLDGGHEHSDRWRTICEKSSDAVSDKDDEEDAQDDYERKRTDLVRFLIERTKNATCPLNINQLAMDYKTEFKSSEPRETTVSRIRSFRQRIREMNQLDIHTKVKLAFALSASIDANFLKEMQKNAIVELDEHRRIKKYEAKDGILKLKEYDRGRAWHKVTRTNKIMATVFNDSCISGDSEFGTSQALPSVAKGRKRAREVSKEDYEESLKLEDNSAMDYDMNNADGFDYDPSNYELDMEHIPIEKKPESLKDIKREKPELQSSSNGKGYYEENFFEDDLLNYVDEHIPEEKKPESFTEVKLELPDGPSTSNHEYHYEEDVEHILFDPKLEFFK